MPPPPQWYGLLPDITYTWPFEPPQGKRVRTSSASTFVGLDDASLSGTLRLSKGFKTPAVSSATISAVSPAAGSTVSSRTPVLQWADSRGDVFYYEVQVSKDPAFGPNAFLYQEPVLRPPKGCATAASPPRPTATRYPAAFPLEPGTPYFWRVRPRVQGDGAPVSWTEAFRFTTG